MNAESWFPSRINKWLKQQLFKSVSAPSNPDAGYIVLYHDSSDGKLKIKNSSGNIVILSDAPTLPIAISDVTNLQTELNAKLESPIAISDVTNLQTTLDSKIQKQVITNTHRSGGVFANTTAIRYHAVGGLFEELLTENEAKIKFPAGTMKNMFLNVQSNPSTGFTATLRKNGANTTLSIPVGSGATGYFTDTDSVSISEGDDLNYSVSAVNSNVNNVSGKIEFIPSGP